MINNELPPIAEAYLADLERALAGVEPRERAETIAAIRDHIVDELNLDGPGTVDERAAAAIASLGSVDAIAASASIGAGEVAAYSAPPTAVAASALNPDVVAAATPRRNWLPWLITLICLLAIPLVIWQPWNSSSGGQTPGAATPAAGATAEWLTHADAAGRAAQGALHVHPGATVIKIEPEGPTVFTVLVRTATGNGLEVYIDSNTGEHVFEHPEELPEVAGGSGPAVTALEAIDTVLREQPGSRIVSLDLGSEANSAVWTVVAADATGQREVYVDATSGNIVRHEFED